MKKFILVLLVFAFVSSAAFAFDILSFPPPVEGGNIMIDAGLGLRWVSYSGKMALPPLFVQGEFALPVGVPISVGAEVSLYRWKYDWPGSSSDGWTYTVITPAVRANWHWGFDISWLDFYVGTSMGWNIVVVKYRGNQTTGAKGGFFHIGFHAGAHFYFTDFIGVVVESGFPYWVKAGVALKF